MERFNVTYDIVTPESAEQGDYADCGFVSSNGDHNSVESPPVWGEAAGAIKRTNAMRLRDALRLVYPQESDGRTFREVDGRSDYQTGAEERRALHAPDSISPASMARLARVLGF